ncbi:MAG: hypothetical protein BJ554DRAFT_5403 [Olpidium bornovanus]|uniref:Uncharacterized protein n=1 Tax=Olpidium bornovanus TaxID=278681 RepID=A0A8H8DL44_9FUNG|nr:MAG: hypothetical protein BJ554DRAFT_5403 [Olpidium bornovanus]
MTAQIRLLEKQTTGSCCDEYDGGQIHSDGRSSEGCRLAAPALERALYEQPAASAEPITIHSDKRDALLLAQNPCIEKNEVHLERLGTADMTADAQEGPREGKARQPRDWTQDHGVSATCPSLLLLFLFLSFCMFPSFLILDKPSLNRPCTARECCTYGKRVT